MSKMPIIVMERNRPPFAAALRTVPPSSLLVCTPDAPFEPGERRSAAHNRRPFGQDAEQSAGEESGGGVVVAADGSDVGADHQRVTPAADTTLNAPAGTVRRDVVQRLPEEVGRHPYHVERVGRREFKDRVDRAIRPTVQSDMQRVGVVRCGGSGTSRSECEQTCGGEHDQKSSHENLPNVLTLIKIPTRGEPSAQLSAPDRARALRADRYALCSDSQTPVLIDGCEFLQVTGLHFVQDARTLGDLGKRERSRWLFGKGP